MVPIEQYLMNMKSMLFFYFYRGCSKVQCSLDNPKYICLIKKKIPYGFDLLVVMGIASTYSYLFLFDDCNYSEDHEIFAIRCENSLYNLNGFGRNYFAFICCTCVR